MYKIDENWAQVKRMRIRHKKSAKLDKNGELNTDNKKWTRVKKRKCCVAVPNQFSPINGVETWDFFTRTLSRG